MVLYNLGKCSFLHNKLSSNFFPKPAKVAIRFEVCQPAQFDRSNIKGNPLCISKHLHNIEKWNNYRILWNTEEHKKSRRRA